MSCEQIRQWLDDYVSGGLESAQRTAVLAHLLNCADCEQAARQLRALRVALNQTPEVEPSAGFSGRVRERLVREGFVIAPRERAWWRWFSTEVMSAALGATAVLWVTIYALPFMGWASPLALLHKSAQSMMTFSASVFQTGRAGIVSVFNNSLPFGAPTQTVWLLLVVGVFWNLWIQWRAMRDARLTLEGE